VIKPLSLIVTSLLISACKPVSEQGSAILQQMPSAQCIESQSQCEISTEASDFSIKFSQLQMIDNIKTDLPFVIELSQLVSKVTDLNVAKKMNITKVSAYLEGKDMFMGKVPVFFEKAESSNKFLAQSLLANCTEEQMVWRLWITIKVGEQEQTSFIDFTSERL